MNTRHLGTALALICIGLIPVQGLCHSTTKASKKSQGTSRIKGQGTFGASATVLYMQKDDVLRGTSVLDLQSTDGLQLQFVGFGNPVSGTSYEPVFEMKLRLEITGLGTVFDGFASDINGRTFSIPSGLGSSGVQVLLNREIRALKNAAAGNYVNEGRVTITRI